MKLKIITIFGTRPEIIRLSCIIPKLDEYFIHKMINTMQNDHKNLNEIFIRDLGLRKPDYSLNIKHDSTGNLIGDVIAQTYEILQIEKPDCVLVLGDTNSALSTIAAKHLKIPIFHLEAGNRSFDINLPEEINRKIIDEIADINLVYSERARNNLLLEGKKTSNIFKTGSPLFEVIEFYKNKINESKILQDLNLVKDDFFLVSMHRNENTNDVEKIKTLISNIDLASKKYNKQIIFSLHPRTKDIISKNNIIIPKHFRMLEPFGFFDYLNLQINSYCVISDSGSLAEESYIMNFKAVSLRNSTERQESQEFGNFLIANLTSESLLNAINLKVKETNIIEKNNDYIINNVSSKVINIIQSYAKGVR